MLIFTLCNIAQASVRRPLSIVSTMAKSCSNNNNHIIVWLISWTVSFMWTKKLNNFDWTAQLLWKTESFLYWNEPRISSYPVFWTYLNLSKPNSAYIWTYPNWAKPIQNYPNLCKQKRLTLDLKPLRFYVEFSEQNGRPNLKNVLFKFRS